MVNKIRKAQARAEKLRPPSKVAGGRVLSPSLLEFIPEVSPKFASPHHLSPVIQRLERAHLEPIKCAFTVPPQHRKSQSVLHAVAYWLKANPALRIIYASYNQRFAERQVMYAHDYCERIGVQSDPRMANRADWKTLQGGGIIARGRSSGVTGEAGDIVVIDDLFKDRKEAESKIIRDDAWNFFTDVVETRTHNGSSVIVFFTRWHEDDTIGRLMKHMPEFEVLRIPALADGLDANGKEAAPDPLGRELGDPLLPEQKSKEALERLRDNPATRRTCLSLYQGLPRDDKTRIFGDVHYYDELPKEGYRVVCGMDGAYTESSNADHSVFGRGRFANGKLYLEHVHFDKTTADRFFKAIKPMAGGHRIRWRGSGTEKGVAQMAVADGVPLDFETTNTNKLANNSTVAKEWNDGNVLLPNPEKFPAAAEWIELLLEQTVVFTGLNDPEDDFIDMLGNVWEATRFGPATVEAESYI